MNRAVALLAIGDVTWRVSTMLAWIVMARTLGDEGFGLVSWGLAIVAYASIAADGGLGVLGTRELAKSSQSATVQELRTLRLCLAFIVTGIIILAGRELLDDNVRWAVLVASALWLIPMSLNPEWILQGRHRIAWVGCLRGTLGISFLALVLFWSLSDLAYSASAALLRPTAEIVIVLLLLVISIRGGHWPFSRLNLNRSIALLKQSLPMAGATLLTGVYAANLDVLVLGETRTMAEAGQYAAAFRLYLMLCVVPKLLLVPAYPRFAAVSEDRTVLQQEIDRFSRLSLSIGLLAVALTWTLSGELTELLFGSTFQPAASILRLLTFASVAVLLNAPFPSCLLASGRTGSALLCFTSALAISVGINLLVTPTWGMPAAASAVVLAEVAVLATGWKACQRHLGVSLWSGTGVEFILAGLVGVAAFLCRTLLVATGLGPAATTSIVATVTIGLWLGIHVVRRHRAHTVRRE